MSPEDLRFYFLVGGIFLLSLYKIAHIAWRRGRRSVLRDHFSAILRTDPPPRQRL